MTCNYCNGVDSIEQQNTRFCACENPAPFIVENVPALVCALCGDKAYSGETLTQLEKVRDNKVSIGKLRPIRVVDFGEIDKIDENVVLMAGFVGDLPSESVAFSYGTVRSYFLPIHHGVSSRIMDVTRMMGHSMQFENEWTLLPQPADSPSVIDPGYCTFQVHNARSNPTFGQVVSKSAWSTAL